MRMEVICSTGQEGKAHSVTHSPTRSLGAEAQSNISGRFPPTPFYLSKEATNALSKATICQGHLQVVSGLLTPSHQGPLIPEWAG